MKLRVYKRLPRSHAVFVVTRNSRTFSFPLVPNSQYSVVKLPVGWCHRPKLTHTPHLPLFSSSTSWKRVVFHYLICQYSLLRTHLWKLLIGCHISMSTLLCLKSRGLDIRYFDPYTQEIRRWMEGV